MSEENGNGRTVSKKYLWVYIGILSGVAMILILLSYGAQLRLQRDLEISNEKLFGKLDTTSGALQVAESALAASERQKQEIEVLEQENRLLEEINAQQKEELELLSQAVFAAQSHQDKQVQAAEILWKLTESWYSKEYNAAETLVLALETDGLSEFLSDEGKAQYSKIKEALE